MLPVDIADVSWYDTHIVRFLNLLHSVPAEHDALDDWLVGLFNFDLGRRGLGRFATAPNAVDVLVFHPHLAALFHPAPLAARTMSWLDRTRFATRLAFVVQVVDNGPAEEVLNHTELWREINGELSRWQSFKLQFENLIVCDSWYSQFAHLIFCHLDNLRFNSLPRKNARRWTSALRPVSHGIVNRAVITVAVWNDISPHSSLASFTTLVKYSV